jgi:DNA polymerase II large subunit
MREVDARYFERIDERLEDALSVAETARAQGKDPSQEVEIPVAEDMADRVENLLGIPRVAERVRSLEVKGYGREAAVLELARDFAEGRVGDYDTREGKIEGAVRTAVALLTEGVVAAPIEGIDRVELAFNDDGSEFVRVFYAGPIRSAGGTAQALSVLVADYVRALLGIEGYKPREDEIERYAEEIDLYDDDVGLQYSPSASEIKYIARHCPVMLDGESTGGEEVSGYRDLERVGTNTARGGMCLVLAEGIALKAPKIKRYTRQLEEIDWPWLEDLIDGSIPGQDPEPATNGVTQTDEGAAEAPSPEPQTPDSSDDEDRLEPDGKYLRDLIAGRPVFAHPSEPGGFRLRYGRARNHGFATAGVHPATMHIVDDFLATGTQLKIERPGKAAGVVPVDTIEGPTVKLASGEVRPIDDPETALELRNGVVEILDLGEYLVNYGEFVENNHPLAPASYVVEWWRQEFAAAGADLQALEDAPEIDLAQPTPSTALKWADTYDAPLHPAYTYLWHDLDVEAYEALVDAVSDGTVAEDGLQLANTEAVTEALETLLVPHHQGETVTIEDWRPLIRSLGFDETLTRNWERLSASARESADALAAVNEVAPFTVRERAPTRVGSRMGRPEKSEVREMNPAVHGLFPIGEAGGDQRDVGAAAKHTDDMQDTPGQVEVDIGRRRCPNCGTEGFRPACPECGAHTEPEYHCRDCGTAMEPAGSGRLSCPRCDGEGTSVDSRTIDVRGAYQDALDTMGERENAFEILKGVKGLMSRTKTPEPLEKGVLRAVHGVSTFKDGTVRYDMTDLPVTSLRPAELDVSVEQFRALGYERDVNGEPLEYDDQLVALRAQDIVLSSGAAQHLMQVADFVDDLLERFYGLDPFYGVDERADLVGELVFGLAPHTSAAVVGRIVGFTDAAVGYAHPYFHAAKRRNCFHPETKVWYRDETGKWRYERIERLVEDRLDPDVAREDDFGALVQDLDGGVFVPSIDHAGTESVQPVNALSKHPSPDHLVQIRSRSGREIEVTPDHEVHVFDGEALIAKRASAVQEGDALVLPSHLDVVKGSSVALEIDLLEAFIGTDEIENMRLMVKGLAKDALYDLFSESLGAAWEGQFHPLQSTADYLGLTKKRLSNYLYRKSIPVSLLREFFDSVDELLDWVPNDVSLGLRRDRTEINRFVEINRRVATLLGYYAAEGFTRLQDTAKGVVNQTTICGTEDQARAFFAEILSEEFGTDPYEENRAKVTASGRLIRVCFDTIFDAGVSARTKRVPQCVFDAPEEIVAAYLSGYFSGDGYVHSNGLSISAVTISRELKEDIVALLTRLGITARVSTPEQTPLHEKFPDFYDDDDPSVTSQSYVMTLFSQDAMRYAEAVGFHLDRKADRLHRQASEVTPQKRRAFDGGGGDYLTERVTSVEFVESEVDYTYCLAVNETHSLIANDLSVKQCDGDEDCVMLLMDGLLNFSQSYLPDRRGGRMDAALVMSSRIDPTEIDDEAHNMDTVDAYPLEFYEATRELADPSDVEIQLAGDLVETEDAYAGFAHTHDTSDIALGPALSAYKTLESMTDKLDAQLELARKLAGVDETDVAERIIEYHFLPDLLGNLRAFSRQETRCLDCGTKYRRMPLTGTCRECGGNVNLTVHEGSVSKYLETAIEIADAYGAREYTVQRLQLLERTIESVFENDKDRPSTLGEFM